MDDATGVRDALLTVLQCCIPPVPSAVSSASRLQLHFHLIIDDRITQAVHWSPESAYHKYFNSMIHSLTDVMITSRFHVVPSIKVSYSGNVTLSQARNLLALNDYRLHDTMSGSALDTVYNFVVLYSNSSITLMDKTTPVPYNQALIPAWGGLIVSSPDNYDEIFRVFALQLRKLLGIPRCTCNKQTDVTSWEIGIWNAERSRIFHGMYCVMLL